MILSSLKKEGNSEGNAITWMNATGMLNETKQSQNDKHYLVSLR